MKNSKEFERQLIQMLFSNKKEIKGDFQGKITNKYGAEILDIQIDSTEYKELYFIEGEIHPSPKKGDIIRFHKMNFCINSENNFNFIYK